MHQNRNDHNEFQPKSEQPLFRLEGRPIPSLTSMIETYETLAKENEFWKVEFEYSAKEEKTLIEEINYIKLVMKELGPSYTQMEQMIGQLSHQPDDECLQLKQKVEVMEQQIKLFREQAGVAIETERQKVETTLREQQEYFSQKLEDSLTVATVEKEELKAKIKGKRDYIHRKLLEMKEEHERKMEDIRKKHINRLKMKDHLDCQTRHLDLSREIKDLEKEFERLKKPLKTSPTNPPRASSTPKNKRNKLCFFNDVNAGEPLHQCDRQSHPAVSSTLSKQKEDNQRKRKLFSVNAHFTDF